MEISELAALSAASASAIAAAAAWRTAAINARSFRRSTEPTLVAQVLNVDGMQGHADLYNAGGGIAVGCSYMLVVGDSKASGHLGYGTLKTR